jgi:hypothetical protein
MKTHSSSQVPSPWFALDQSIWASHIIHEESPKPVRHRTTERDARPARAHSPGVVATTPAKGGRPNRRLNLNQGGADPRPLATRSWSRHHTPVKVALEKHQCADLAVGRVDPATGSADQGPAGAGGNDRPTHNSTSDAYATVVVGTTAASAPPARPVSCRRAKQP